MLWLLLYKTYIKTTEMFESHPNPAMLVFIGKLFDSVLSDEYNIIFF